MWLLIHFPRNYVMIQKLNTLRNAFWNDTIPLPFPMHMLIGSSSQIWIFLACQFHPVSTLHLTCGKCLVGLGPAANWAISVLQLLGRWTCPTKNKLQQLCLGASTLENKKKELGGPFCSLSCALWIDHFQNARSIQLMPSPNFIPWLCPLLRQQAGQKNGSLAPQLFPLQWRNVKRIRSSWHCFKANTETVALGMRQSLDLAQTRLDQIWTINRLSRS